MADGCHYRAEGRRLDAGRDRRRRGRYDLRPRDGSAGGRARRVHDHAAARPVDARRGASQAIGWYGRWSNPITHLMPRTETSVAAWHTEGRTGVAVQVDRSLRRHLDFGPDPHVGFDALWMATTDLGYLDRGLWDDAGTVEAGPWGSTTAHPGGGGGAAVLPARLARRGGGGYWNPGAGVVSTNRYDFEAFGRFTGEASVRSQLLGVRLFR